MFHPIILKTTKTIWWYFHYFTGLRNYKAYKMEYQESLLEKNPINSFIFIRAMKEGYWVEGRAYNIPTTRDKNSCLT